MKFCINEYLYAILVYIKQIKRVSLQILGSFNTFLYGQNDVNTLLIP